MTCNIMLRCVTLCTIALLACGDDDKGCPDSLASNSAEWRAPPDASAQCTELARTLGSSGLDIGGDAAVDCSGSMSQTETGGQCRATITSTCEDGLSFELRCVVKRDRTADCDVTIDAAELERACQLRVLLR